MSKSLVVVRVKTQESEACSDWLFSLGATAIEQREQASLARPQQNRIVELCAGFDNEDAVLKAHDLISHRWPTRIESTGDESRWRDRWLDFIEPSVVTPFLVHAPWHNPEQIEVLRDEGLIELVIDPGTSFGSGHHPTTELCLSEITSQLRPGDQVLDVGFGSGILAIAAAKLAASRVIGFDVSSEAVTNAAANSQSNHVDSVCQFVLTDGTIASSHPETSGGEARFDIVVANIVIGDLMPLLVELCEQAKDRLILSGFFSSQRELVLRELEDFELVNTSEKDEWATVSLRRRT